MFITSKVFKNAKAMVLKKIEVHIREDFNVSTNYALELKHCNPRSSVNIVSARHNAYEILVFQKIYICLTSIREGFTTGCRRLITLDGCFLKGIMKG